MVRRFPTSLLTIDADRMTRPKDWTLPALDPRPQGQPSTWTVRLAQEHVDGLTRYGVGPRYYRLLLVPATIENPATVFEGLEREGQDESLCYVGRPPERLSQRYHRSATAAQHGVSSICDEEWKDFRMALGTIGSRRSRLS